MLNLKQFHPYLHLYVYDSLEWTYCDVGLV